jgi:hypothetical protein
MASAASQPFRQPADPWSLAPTLADLPPSLLVMERWYVVRAALS